MGIFDVFVAVIWGIVEGITEWLPVSSTGHMILVEEFLKFQDEQFSQMFLVVVQLGAILAVVLLFWSRIWPFRFTKRERGESIIDWKIMQMWFKIIVACLPAAIVGILFDDWIDEVFYNAYVVAGALIVYGILFIVIEKRNETREPKVKRISQLSVKTVLLIGVFQMMAMIPGTSRSGATIVGALALGVSRSVAAEFTFFLAIPVMFGASALKLFKFGLAFTPMQVFLLLLGMIVSFAVSVIAIKFLMKYIKKHEFKAFGYYRIVLGIVVFLFFGIQALFK